MLRILLASVLLVASNVFAQDINALDPTKVYDTGNLTTFNQNGSTTTSAWQNVGQWGGEITCWAPGMPGYCGPNPYVNSFGTGSINFSYGLTDLYQLINVANALPNSGTGLRVNGYNFSFIAKNGNGWDNGQTDYLSAYVNFYGADGSTLRNDYYNLNYTFNWTSFNFSKTFDNPYLTNQLSTVRYGLVGGDSNGWAGPYGPEVGQVSFSLKYSVDPCYVNVFSSPSCPGFMEAINKLSSPTSAFEPTQIVYSTGTSTDVVETPVTTSPATVASIPATTTNAVETAPTTSIIAAPILTDTGRTRTTNVNAVDIARSVNNMVAAQTQSIVSQSIQQSLNVEIASEQASTNTGNESSVLGSGLTINTGSTAMSTGSSSQTYSSNTIIDVANTVPSVSLPNLSGSSMFGNSMPGLEGPINTNNSTTLSSSNMDSSNPTSTLSLANMSNRPTINTDSEQNSNKESTANRSEPIAEFTTGIDARQLQVVPIGFNTYLTAQIRDAAFYAPKDIYKGQNNVDNVRALRQLASDRLHEEMVNQQYKR